MSMLHASVVDDEIESKEPTGKLYHIACKNWMTAGGELIPLSFKFEGDNGELQSVKVRRVISSEDKNYSGIPSREFVCEICTGGLRLDVKLIFYCESCLWVMIV